MLDRDELRSALQELGINEDSYRVLALLPLVSVAWSDGKVQAAEQSRIIEVAQANGLLTGGGQMVLERWLTNEPLAEEYERGFKLLIELARRQRGMGSDMNAATLRELIDFSFEVANAAGGLFGKVWTISPAEQDALQHVAETLSIDDGQSWGELLEDLDKGDGGAE